MGYRQSGRRLRRQYLQDNRWGNDVEPANYWNRGPAFVSRHGRCKCRLHYSQFVEPTYLQNRKWGDDLDTRSYSFHHSSNQVGTSTQCESRLPRYQWGGKSSRQVNRWRGYLAADYASCYG